MSNADWLISPRAAQILLCFPKSGLGINASGSVSLMFTKIKETERGRHRIPTPHFFASHATPNASACEKNLPKSFTGSQGVI